MANILDGSHALPYARATKCGSGFFNGLGQVTSRADQDAAGFIHPFGERSVCECRSLTFGLALTKYAGMTRRSGLNLIQFPLALLTGPTGAVIVKIG